MHFFWEMCAEFQTNDLQFNIIHVHFGSLRAGCWEYQRKHKARSLALSNWEPCPGENRKLPRDKMLSVTGEMCTKCLRAQSKGIVKQILNQLLESNLCKLETACNALKVTGRTLSISFWMNSYNKTIACCFPAKWWYQYLLGFFVFLRS